MRLLWVLVAWTALALAVLGIVLPGLPTTPFVLVAAWAAAKGSRSLHAWLLAHPLFGPMIRDWQAHGAVSRRAKVSALATMALCAVLLFLTAPKAAYAAIGTGCMVVVAIWLWRRPEPPGAPPQEPPAS